MNKAYALASCFLFSLSSFSVFSADASSSSSAAGTPSRSLVFNREDPDKPDKLDFLAAKHPDLARDSSFYDEDKETETVLCAGYSRDLANAFKYKNLTILEQVAYSFLSFPLNHQINENLLAKMGGVTLAESLYNEMVNFSAHKAQLPYQLLMKETVVLPTLVHKQEKLKQLLERSEPFKLLSPFQKVLCQRRMDLGRNMVEDLVLSVYTMREIIEQNGEALILFMGRSPSFLKVIYEALHDRMPLGSGKAECLNPSYGLNFS